jgi:hypothetical protein
MHAPRLMPRMQERLGKMAGLARMQAQPAAIV